MIVIRKHSSSVRGENSPATAPDREAVPAELAERFGTPLYAYDLDEIDARVAELRALFPSEANPRLMYSFKANPLPSVAATTRKAGCRADLTSEGEIRAAQQAGFDLSDALYGGPGKSNSELAAAISAGVRSFSVESEHDLRALSRASLDAGVNVRALLRINPSEPPKAKLAMSGVASQFGFEESFLREQGREAIREAAESVSLVGVHIYWGTQIGDADALLACFSQTVSIAEEISHRLGFPLQILNLGGGFPWPYSHSGAAPDLSPLRTGLLELFRSANAAKNAEWWFESGRYLVASSGTLVARVMDVKTSKDKVFLVLDTGIHHLGGMSGLGRIPRFSVELQVPGARRSAEEVTVDVVGQLCTPLDCIGKRIALPRPEVGDLLTIPNTGAYGITASVCAFLSRPAPAEVAHRGGRVEAVHRLCTGHEVLP